MGRKLLIASALLVALMFLPAPLYPLWLARFVVREAALLPAILAGWALLRIRRESPPAPRRTGACVGAALLIVASLLPVLAPLPLCLRHGVTPSLWQYLTGAPSLSIPVERNVALASDRPDLLVDVYRTAKPGADLRPAVIVLHSGSFHFGDKGEAPAVSRQLAAAGYVVAADGKETPADANQEIAVQFVLADYRNVNGVWLPFHIIKAINGAPVDEWKIEKYKLNPDLKPKRFEKR